MMKSILFGSLVTVFAFACGGGGGSGGSGVDGGKRLVELSDAEITDLCEFAVAADPARSITCSDNTTVSVGQESVATCVQEANESAAAAPNCPVTVSQYEACISALGAQSDAELCEFNFPQACAPLLQEACLGE